MRAFSASGIVRKRRFSIYFFLFMLAGVVFGCAAGSQCRPLFPKLSVLDLSGRYRWICLYTLAFFPALIYAAAMLHRKGLVGLLLLCKSFAVSMVLVLQIRGGESQTFLHGFVLLLPEVLMVPVLAVTVCYMLQQDKFGRFTGKRLLLLNISVFIVRVCLRLRWLPRWN